MEDTEPKEHNSANNTEENPNERRIANATWALFWATFGLVVVTIFLFFVTYFIFKEATNQSKLTREIFHVSDSINRESLKATKQGIELSNTNASKSLELAHNTFNSESRPYLYIKEMTLANVVVGKEWTLKSVITNVGKIPAFKARCTYNFRLDTFIYHHKFPFDKSITTQVPSTPPNGVFILNSNTARISQERFDAINSKKIYLCFYGKISYTDIYKGEYFTTFSIIYNPDKPAEFIYNPTFNDVK